MLFSSFEFFLFFAAYLPFHLYVPPRYRIAVVIAGSTIFYGYWNVRYVWVPYLLIGVTYAGALFIEAAIGAAQRRRRLIGVLAVTLAPLIFFKYTNFIASTLLAPISNLPTKLVEVPLPLGISFFTFTLIAYLVDFYRSQFPRVGARDLAAYTLFFPHSIAGPIFRPHEFIPQLPKLARAIDYRFTLGTLIFAAGLVKKLVFADQIALVVDPVYAGDEGLSAQDYLVAIYGFSLQIYCDFSGYTDMAIGLAMMLGVRFPQNFERPYASASISEFWRRWHITLSRWIRDYIYIPLGGSRHGHMATARNLFVTMGLAGLWHGANWTFVLWGIVHAAGIGWSRLADHVRFLGAIRKLPKWLLILAAFHFVTLAWILFRARSLERAWRVLRGPFVAPWTDNLEFLSQNAFPFTLLAIFFATHWLDSHSRLRLIASRWPRPFVWSLIALAFVLAITISTGSSAEFIYFEF